MQPLNAYFYLVKHFIITVFDFPYDTIPNLLLVNELHWIFFKMSQN